MPLTSAHGRDRADKRRLPTAAREDDGDGYLPGGRAGSRRSVGFLTFAQRSVARSYTPSLHGSSAPFDVTTLGGTLSFDGHSVDQAITLIAAAVPEPARWALMIGGFGVVGAGMRRPRVAPVVAV